MNRNRFEYFILATLAFLIIIVGWSAVTYSGIVKPFFLPPPTVVFESLLDLLIRQGFLKDIGVSIFRISIGFFVASVLAVPIGLLIGLNKRYEALIAPSAEFVRYTPIAAAIPLFILWFGIGESEKILIIATSVFIQLVIMVANSVSFTPKELIHSAQTLGASPTQVLTKVIYAYAQPRILDDLRISMGWAWSGLMIAEIVGSTSGIGYVIIQSQRLLQSDQVIAAIIVVGVLGIITDFIFKQLYRYYFPWAPRTGEHA